MKAKKTNLNLTSLVRLQDQPRWVLEVAGVAALAAAYGVFSLAIDTGAWWQYLGGLILTVQGIRWIARAINYHGKEK